MALLDKLLNPILGDGPDYSEIDRLTEKQVSDWENLELPELSQFTPEELEYLGDVGYTPGELTEMGDTEMKGIKVDPRLKEHQLSALQELSTIADAGGMTAADEANLARVQNDNAQADRGRREAILQNMAARGMAGSGNELLAQLSSSQAATDRNAQQGLDIAGMAQARALEAMMSRGNMAGGIRDQDFGAQSQIASAQDAINQFNTQNKNNFSQHNADMTYNAGVNNQAVKQGIANQNVDTRNKAAMHNTFTVPQQNYSNQSSKLAGKHGAYGTQITNEHQKHAAEAEKYKFIGGLAGAGAGAFATGTPQGAAAGSQMGQQAGGGAYAMSDKNEKKDIKKVKELDIEEFLGSLSPKKFKFKDESNGQGDFTGFMAQDVADTKLGSEMVEQGEDGKMRYDPVKLQGIQMAAIKFLADKIKETK